MLRKKAVVFAALLAGWSLAAHGTAQAEIIASLKSGFWEGGVDADASGKVNQCFLAAEQVDEHYYVIFRWQEDGLHLTLYREDWALEPGQTFRARVRIDRKLDVEVPGSILKANLVDYVLGLNADARNAVMAGSRMIVEGPVGERNFRLTGTRKVVETLIECADRFMEPESDEPADPTPEVAPQAETRNDDSRSKDADSPEVAEQDGMNTLEGGQQAFDAGQYDLAQARWSAALAGGDLRAAISLGQAYQSGRYFDKDEALAAQLFRQAADGGLAEGHYWYGRALESGAGLAVDPGGAWAQIAKAAEGGYVPAQTRIGHFLEHGVGRAADPIAATEWYAAAAENGDPEAQYRFGLAFLNGQGIGQDDASALYWFDRAALQGHEHAQYELAQLVVRSGAAPDLEEAYLWFRLAANRGVSAAEARLLDLRKSVRRSKTLALDLKAKKWTPDLETQEVRVASPLLRAGPIWQVTMSNTMPGDPAADAECPGGFDERMSFRVPSGGGPVSDFSYTFKMDTRFFGAGSDACIHIRRHGELVAGEYRNGVLSLQVRDFSEGSDQPAIVGYEGPLGSDGTGELYNTEPPFSGLRINAEEVQ